MSQWIVRFLFLMIAFGAGVLMFLLKYHVIEKEEELQKLHAQIRRDSREIYMLQIEWASANDPMRLRDFVRSQTKFQNIRSSQLVEADSLPIKPAPVPMNPPKFESEGDEL